MKIRILGCGTSTGVPVPGCSCLVCRSGNPKNIRQRTSALITTPAGHKIVVDTSTDFRQQALSADLNQVDAVLYTHAHADHILGLDDLRGFCFLRQTPIPIYGTAQTLKELKRIFHYAFNPDSAYQGGAPPEVSPHEVTAGQKFTVQDLTILPILLWHGQLPVLGYRIDDFAYLTDFNMCPEESFADLRGVRTLVIDGLRLEKHATHLSIPESIEFVEKIQAERAFLTHMTHSVDYEAVSANLPPKVRLAYDGLEINF